MNEKENNEKFEIINDSLHKRFNYTFILVIPIIDEEYLGWGGHVHIHI